MLTTGIYGQSARPVAVLVDQIGGRALPLRGEVRSDNKVKSNSSITSIELRAFELMNAERQASGLPLLEWDDGAATLARQHAGSMAESKFFSHTGRDGETVDVRASRLGVKWRAIGENIATMKGYEDPGAMAVETWMRSTAHKKNILNGIYNRTAIGAAFAADGTIYFTQVFLSR